MNPSNETLRKNLVYAVRPFHLRVFAADVGRALLVPWRLPWVLFMWVVGPIYTWRLHAKMSPGAREYYRSQTAQGAIRRMSGRKQGIVAGVVSLLVYGLVGLRVGAAIEPGYLGLAVGGASAIVLAVATGVFFGRR
jgi:hypothetical protein